MSRFLINLLFFSFLISQENSSLYQFSTIKEANLKLKEVGIETAEGRKIKFIIDEAYRISGTKTARGWLIDSVSFQKRDEAIRLLTFKESIRNSPTRIESIKEPKESNAALISNWEKSIQFKTYRIVSIIFMSLIILLALIFFLYGSVLLMKKYFSTSFNQNLFIFIESKINSFTSKYLIKDKSKSENISDDKEIDDDKILSFEKELEAFSTMSKDEKLDFIMKDQDLSYDQAVMYLDYKMYKDE